MNPQYMSVEEVTAHLRKKYGFFECVKKSDRLFIPDNIWKQIDWTEKEIKINAGLPHKMWNMRHDDNPWPLCKKFRGHDAYGPRARKLNSCKFLMTPPTLVEGRGITRWMGIKDMSVLEIPLFEDYKNLWTPENIPDQFDAYERKPNHPNFGKKILMSKHGLFLVYGPTALQKFSDKSWLKRNPYHISYHKMLKRREAIGEGKDITGADRVWFYRYGWRWDSLDDYYNKRGAYAGLAWN